MVIPDHDVYVMSGNWAVFAAPRFRPNIWYCHTPVRVFYDLRDRFLASLPPVVRWGARRWIDRRRPEYERAVARTETIVANSRNVAARVERFLGRKSVVVYPPVDTSRYRFAGVGDTWLAVSRLSYEKRIDLVVDTFRRLPREKLVVVGGSQSPGERERLIRGLKPPSNIEFLGEVAEPRLQDLYATCKGLVATSIDEDFGLAPVEAMAAGKAVIAVDEGGYRETVVDGQTGWLVAPDAAALSRAVTNAETQTLGAMREACEARARAFDRSVFVERMRGLIEQAVHAR